MPGGRYEKLLRLMRDFDRARDEVVAEISRLTGAVRPCGCGRRGRHLPTCEKSANETGWDGSKLSCCGSRSRTRHKRGCARNAGDGKLPAGVWTCVCCSERYAERPSVCGSCGARLFVQS